MNALSLYHDLKERGVILEAQGEYLKVDAPVGVVTEEVKTALVEFKPTLLRLLPGLSKSSHFAKVRATGPDRGSYGFSIPSRTSGTSGQPRSACPASLPKPTEEEKEADGSKRKRLAGRPAWSNQS